MQTRIGLAILVLCFSAWSQTKKPAVTTPPKRTPAPTAATADPVAIIDTTAGKMHCTLFPKQAPIGIDTSIGLASGTKDWTNPTTHAKKHGVPLYDGTIFHRVIPEFMIQGGDPTGTGMGDPGYKFKNETSPRPDLRSPRTPRLRQLRSGHQRLAVLHHRSPLCQPERRIHHLRPVR